jgi:hypothetical protein
VGAAGLSPELGVTMPLPRLQLFEFNDAPWAPAALREGIIDSLSVTLERGRLLDGLVEPFTDFLHEASAGRDADDTVVLDLGSGAGGPAKVLLGALAARGRRPKLVLTDLHPRVESWREVEAAFPGQVSSVSEPVDATAVPAALGRGRPRVIINVLHHFPPAVVSRVLEDAVRSGESIFIAEGFGRNPLGFAAFAPVGIPTLLRAPLRGQRRLEKALYFWATPLGFAASVWDGLVSTMRIHTEADLRAMVAPFGDRYDWRFGWYPLGGWSRGYYWRGTPK